MAQTAVIRAGIPELEAAFVLASAVRADIAILDGMDHLPPEFDLDKYAEALIERFGNLNFDSLDTEGAAYNAVRLWNVFVPQSIRECQDYPPRLFELPKEEQVRLIAREGLDAKLLDFSERERHDLWRAYFDQTQSCPGW